MSTNPRPYRRRIGEILVNDGIVSAEQIEEALGIQKTSGELLGTILVEMGAAKEGDIARTLCVQYQLPFICLSNYDFDDKLVKLFPKEFLHRHKIFPFDKVGDMLLLMVTEIPSDNALAEIPKLTKLNAGLYIGYGSEINTMLIKLVPLTTAAPQAAGPAVTKGAKAAKPAKVTAAPKVVQEEDDDPEGDTLVFGASQKSFLAELDSTWDSIFDQVTDKEDTKSKD